MSEVSLTATMRSNLLSLQTTQSLMDMTQERLSTGKKVNSAIDNPTAYYTAQSLNNRAADLSSLLDNLGQAVQTIKAANEAIETITTFAQQAKSLANSAHDVSNNMKTRITSTKELELTDLSGAGKIYIDSRADKSSLSVNITAATPAGAATDLSMNIDLLINNEIKTVTVSKNATSITAADIASEISRQTGLKATENAGTITIEAGENSSVAIADTVAAGANTPAVSQTTGIDAYTLTNASTIDNVITNINTPAIGGKPTLNASIDSSNGKLTITADAGAKESEVNIGIAVSGAAAKTLYGINGTIDTKVTDETAIKQRNKYSDQFNQVLNQIDQLSKDAGYKGINLLNENNLKVVFNEDRSSYIDIQGVNASSKGLGLESVDHGGWNKDEQIESSITQIDNAIIDLRAMASDFGNNYSIVQNREDFTEGLINILTEGADKLTLADMNEESANMLALQTRQQLAINSLSLASQASQSVLKLF